MLMEGVALVLWISFGVVFLLGLAARIRNTCLHSHLTSLRDRGEHRYQRVNQHAPGMQPHACA